jgi:hypothetical protein
MDCGEQVTASFMYEPDSTALAVATTVGTYSSHNV